MKDITHDIEPLESEYKKGKTVGNVMIIDLAMLPYGWRTDKWIEIMDRFGILFCDTALGKTFNKPFMIDGRDIKSKVIDISTDEGKRILQEISDKMDGSNNK